MSTEIDYGSRRPTNNVPSVVPMRRGDPYMHSARRKERPSFSGGIMIRLTGKLFAGLSLLLIFGPNVAEGAGKLAVTVHGEKTHVQCTGSRRESQIFSWKALIDVNFDTEQVSYYQTPYSR